MIERGSAKSYFDENPTPLCSDIRKQIYRRAGANHHTGAKRTTAGSAGRHNTESTKKSKHSNDKDSLSLGSLRIVGTNQQASGFKPVLAAEPKDLIASLTGRSNKPLTKSVQIVNISSTQKNASERIRTVISKGLQDYSHKQVSSIPKTGSSRKYSTECKDGVTSRQSDDRSLTANDHQSSLLTGNKYLDKIGLFSNKGALANSSGKHVPFMKLSRNSGENHVLPFVNKKRSPKPSEASGFESSQKVRAAKQSPQLKGRVTDSISGKIDTSKANQQPFKVSKTSVESGSGKPPAAKHKKQFSTELGGSNKGSTISQLLKASIELPRSKHTFNLNAPQAVGPGAEYFQGSSHRDPKAGFGVKGLHHESAAATINVGFKVMSSPPQTKKITVKQKSESGATASKHKWSMSLNLHSNEGQNLESNSESHMTENIREGGDTQYTEGRAKAAYSEHSPPSEDKSPNHKISKLVLDTEEGDSKSDPNSSPAALEVRRHVSGQSDHGAKGTTSQDSSRHEITTLTDGQKHSEANEGNRYDETQSLGDAKKRSDSSLVSPGTGFCRTLKEGSTSHRNNIATAQASKATDLALCLEEDGEARSAKPKSIDSASKKKGQSISKPALPTFLEDLEISERAKDKDSSTPGSRKVAKKQEFSSAASPSQPDNKPKLTFLMNMDSDNDSPATKGAAAVVDDAPRVRRNKAAVVMPSFGGSDNDEPAAIPEPTVRRNGGKSKTEMFTPSQERGANCETSPELFSPDLSNQDGSGSAFAGLSHVSPGFGNLPARKVKQATRTPFGGFMDLHKAVDTPETNQSDAPEYPTKAEPSVGEKLARLSKIQYAENEPNVETSKPAPPVEEQANTRKLGKTDIKASDGFGSLFSNFLEKKSLKTSFTDGFNWDDFENDGEDTDNTREKGRNGVTLDGDTMKRNRVQAKPSFSAPKASVSIGFSTSEKADSEDEPAEANNQASSDNTRAGGKVGFGQPATKLMPGLISNQVSGRSIKSILRPSRLKPESTEFVVRPQQMNAIKANPNVPGGLFIPLEDIEEESIRKFETMKNWAQELEKVSDAVSQHNRKVNFTIDDDREEVEIVPKRRVRMAGSPKHSEEKTSRNQDNPEVSIGRKKQPPKIVELKDEDTDEEELADDYFKKMPQLDFEEDMED